MFVKGTRVKVLDNYAGGLSNVAGRMAKVVQSEKKNGNLHHLLDIRGTRTVKYRYGSEEDSYNLQSDVIVTDSEIEEVPYNFKDCEGNTVDIGDTVVYGVHGGGLLKGTVLDFKDETHTGYGTVRKELKMKIECEHIYSANDGLDREMHVKSTYTRWLTNQHSTLIIQKGLAHWTFDPNKIVLHEG